MCQPWVRLVAPSCQAQGSSLGLKIVFFFVEMLRASLKTCSNNFCNAFSTNSGRKGWPGNQNEETSFQVKNQAPSLCTAFGFQHLRGYVPCTTFTSAGLTGHSRYLASTYSETQLPAFVNSCQVKDVYIFAPVQVPIHILWAPPAAAPPNKKIKILAKLPCLVFEPWLDHHTQSSLAFCKQHPLYIACVDEVVCNL